MTIKLGNLLPGQQATLKSQIISKLEIVGGSYAYILPVAFYPDYRRHGARSNNDFVYEFSYEVEIVAEGSHISNLSLPEHAEITDKDETNRRIKVKSQRVSRTIELYYRTADMLMPQLLYAVSPETGEVACTASLVPTFDAVAPQDLFEVVKMKARVGKTWLGFRIPLYFYRGPKWKHGYEQPHGDCKGCFDSLYSESSCRKQVFNHQLRLQLERP